MNAWIKRKNGPDEVINVVMNNDSPDSALVYDLFTAFDQEYLGRILFDELGYWIYDGDILNVEEQEQLGKFINHNMELIGMD